ncbi:MAG: glycosyltransferase family 2 protein [Patescibacteria group bacterium]
MNQPALKTTLVILTRNEITGVRHLLERIPLGEVDEYFAIDYHSTDGTVEFFETHGIPVIRQRRPGRAEAFRLAAKKASGQILVFFSPDGNEDPRGIPRLISMIKKGADLAIASRFMKGSRNEEDHRILKWRAWANQVFTWLANIFFRHSGPYITDTINGYRAITKTAFRKLDLDAQGFAIEYQMTIRALRLGYRIIEISTIEGQRLGGQSTAKAIPTGIQFLGYLLRELRCRRFFSQKQSYSH